MAIHTATALIDLTALAHNFSVIKSIAPQTKILAVLKANAYGHGLERIAQALPQADALGVARIDEALALRAAGITTPIVLLEGFFSDDIVPVLAKHNFQTIIHNEQQLKAITNTKLNVAQPIKVWLKVDTGMHRLGVTPEQFHSFYQQLTHSNNIAKNVISISHLACADDIDSPKTAEQLSLFEQLTEELTTEKSMANSAGIAAWPQAHYQWARPGLMLYGVSPLLNGKGDQALSEIKPVMTLKSSLIAIRELSAGEAVGYSGTWQSKQRTTIGVVAIGYGDGYPRHAANGTPVLVNGRIVPLIGRVSMDMITVDLGVNATDNVGDEVTLWGKGLPVEEVAKHATTIPYELLCNITRRVKVELV